MPGGGTPPSGAQFFEDFSSPASGARFRTEVVHGVDPTSSTSGSVQQWQGDHNEACQGPTTTRTVNVQNDNEMFWWCAPAGPDSGHFMTSMNTLGYAVAAFSPNQVFRNVRRVCWDQNLTDLGGRKWTMVLVIPEAEYQRSRRNVDGHVTFGPNPETGWPYLSYVVPGFFNGTGPSNGIEPPPNSLGVKIHVGTLTTYAGERELESSGIVYKTGADKATRFQHCLIDTNPADGRVQMTQQRANGEVWSFDLDGSIPQGEVRVIFEDDNYDPPKDPGGSGTPSPFTWHWDNISIS